VGQTRLTRKVRAPASHFSPMSRFQRPRLDNFSQYAILMSAPKTDRMAADVLKDI